MAPLLWEGVGVKSVDEAVAQVENGFVFPQSEESHELRRQINAFLAEVKDKGEYMRGAFANAPGVVSVSGLGMMVGIETVKPAAEVVKACMQKGVLCLTAKNKVRLLPALNIPDALLREAVEILLAAMA